jgi:hypothetical protein
MGSSNEAKNFLEQVFPLTSSGYNNACIYIRPSCFIEASEWCYNCVSRFYHTKLTDRQGVGTTSPSINTGSDPNPSLLAQAFGPVGVNRWLAQPIRVAHRDGDGECFPPVEEIPAPRSRQQAAGPNSRSSSKRAVVASLASPMGRWHLHRCDG